MRSPNGASANDPPDAQALLERFSLLPSEAKTLVALMRLGSGTAHQLVPLTSITQTNLYPVLESLRTKQLVQKVPGRTTIWTPVQLSEVIERLEHQEEERFRSAKSALAELGEALKEVPRPTEAARAVFGVVDEVSLLFRYREALAAATEELLVFNRGPFVGEIDVDDDVLGALARGVKARAICRTHELYGPGMGHVLATALAYVDAGVPTRVVDEMALSMALVDRRLALLRFPGRTPDELPYVSSVVVDHPGFGEVLARVFEQSWDEGIPLEPATQQHLTKTKETSTK